MNVRERDSAFLVPTYATEVELLLADGHVMKGKIFLPMTTSTLGHLPILGWLNSTEHFFPFVEDGQETTQIINKELVVQMIKTKELSNVEQELDDLSLHEGVCIEQIEICCGAHVNAVGRLTLDTPKECSRVLDFLNQSGSFFTIQQGDKHCIINKRYITIVKEIERGETDGTDRTVSSKI